MACTAIAVGGFRAATVGAARVQPWSDAAAAPEPLTRMLISDMTKPSERMPEGVPPYWDWASRPRARSLSRLRAFQAFTAWGQLYQCAGTHAPAGEAVEFRDLQAWVLPTGGRWKRIQLSSDLSGAAFAEDYEGPNVAAHYDATPTETTVWPIVRHNFHFWPGAGRVSLQVSRVVGIVVTVNARLAPAVAGSPCMVLSVGGDMWRSLYAPPAAGAAGDVGIGRFKLLKRRWRLFTMTSGPAGLLLSHPVPGIASAGEAS